MRRSTVVLLFICWFGLAVRLPGLFANTFHADEALFASWARLIAVWRDPLLQTVPVDKPPLLFYLQAPFYQMVGTAEFAARLPNFIASVLMIPLTAVLAARLSHNKNPLATAVAALLVACSPLAIQFSPTAFTDPLLSFWVLAALVAAVSGNKWSIANGQLSTVNGGWAIGKGLFNSYFLLLPFLSGLFLGLALATKYQAVLFVPLVGWFVWQKQGYRGVLLAGLGLLGPLTAVLLWDLARTGTFSLWSAQMSSYGGVRLAYSWELWPRLLAWLWLWAAVLGVGWLAGFRFQGSGVRFQGKGFTIHHSQFTVYNSLFLSLFLFIYGILHWFLAIPAWDRYLLPIVPLTAVVISAMSKEQGTKNKEQGARGKEQGTKNKKQIAPKNKPTNQPTNQSSSFILHTSYFILVTLLLAQAVIASQGHFSLGSTPRSDRGAAEIAAVLHDEPYGTVLYDHWYSWHWRYHFFDRGVYVSWFPHGAHLAEELHVFGDDGHNRYLVLPNGDTAVPIQRTVREAGFALQPIHEADGMTLYQLTRNKEQ